MSEKNDNLALLPNGFADLLPPDAQSEVQSIRILMEAFSSFGYQRVKPPLLEFEDSLLAPGPGERLADDTFRVMDPVSHRMLGIRSDITPQIARIVSSRLKNEAKPIRLCYANDVLRTRGSQIRTRRQFVQVGCELVGAPSCPEADVELCVLSLLGLRKIGLQNLTLDLTIPEFVPSLCSALDDEARSIVCKAVQRRDVDALKGYAADDKGVSVLVQAMLAPREASEALDVIEALELDEKVMAYVARLRSVCDGVYQALRDLKIKDVQLTVDLMEQQGFEYHTSLGFTLFSADIAGELGRGGSYEVCFGQTGVCNALAQGFTLYMDTISAGVPSVSRQDVVFVSYDIGWDCVTDLQDQGWVVVRGREGDSLPQECTHIYKNGIVEALS